MVWVGGMSLVLPPTTAIPTALLLEVIASLQLLPQAWRHAHWKSLSWMLGGVVLGMPLGTWALVSVPERPMRLALGLERARIGRSGVGLGRVVSDLLERKGREFGGEFA
jgi:uncharacterized membrane protein YfcA